MSNHAYANYEDTVEEDFVKEVCPEEFSKLQEFLKNHNSSIEMFAYSQLVDEFPDLYENDHDDKPNENLEKECEELWKELKGAFEKLTKLTLSIGFFDAEGRGDEVDGVYWVVGNVYEYTPAGRAYCDRITRKHWCDFG